VIVGAGITGLTAAYLLKRAGRRVVVLERGRCADADTCSTTGHLTCALDTPLTALVGAFGEETAAALWQAGLVAIAQIDEIVRTESIPCQFTWVPGYLHARIFGGGGQSDPDELAHEAEQAAALGFDAHYRTHVPFFERPGVELPNQARFDPRRYLAGLLAKIEGQGCRVFEHTAVDDIHDAPLIVAAGGYAITCDQVLLATHTPPNAGRASAAATALLQSRLTLYTSYAIGGRVPPDRVPDALFWDTEDPYLYLRIERHRGYDYVIFGGEDHKTGQMDDTRLCFERLERRLLQILPEVHIRDRWSGQIIETHDGVPIIGELAPGQFGATGFSGNGLTFGTLAAMMVRDAITGQINPWQTLFDLSRSRPISSLI
jgi:glycine/D-amino acid oxidase-like deaminating enzyme